MSANQANQAIFDFALEAMRKQGEPAYERGQCRYRARVNDSVRKCAFGHFIPDALYSVGMEGKSCREVLLTDDALRDHFNAQFPGHTAMDMTLTRGALISSIQGAHDASIPTSLRREPFLDQFEPRMKDIAHQFKLTYKEPQA